MNLNIGQISLVDLMGMLERKELIINRDYQRGSNLWPDAARSYFIDTILQGYPFPKIYLYQSYNEKTKRPIKELVDGQQRVTTISDFYKGKLRLNSASKNFNGVTYNDLDEDVQRSFLTYQVEASTILSASRAELLEMFRRMNAYTAPLKDAEKRHSTYQGEFKWFVAELADLYSPVLENYKVLTPKQIARMADAEFISELILVLENGIESRSAVKIDHLYKSYDVNFSHANVCLIKLERFFNVVEKELAFINTTFLTKSYVFYSLFCALMAIWYGYPGSDSICEQEPDPSFSIDIEKAIPKLMVLSDAHEEQDEDGPYSKYVEACLSTTTKQAQRLTRAKYLVEAFLG